MTKKLFLIPLLVAPLLLASCGESKPGAFEQGDKLLNAELIREVVESTKEEVKAKSVAETKLTKQLTDAEGAAVWQQFDYGGSAESSGFLVFKQAVTVEAVTTTTFEAYAKKSLKLIATWTETTDPASMIDTAAHFTFLPSADPIEIGYVTVQKRVYVMKDEVKTLDHIEAVAYDEYGHKLVEMSQKAEPGSIAPVTGISVGYEDYDEDTYLDRDNVVVLTITKWTKDHYENYRYVYSEDMQELKAESEADMFPYGVFEPIAGEIEVEGVKYTFTESSDNAIVVYKDGVEEPVCKIPNEVYVRASARVMLDFQFIYVLDNQVASSNDSYTYVTRSGAGIDLRYKQEIHSVNLLTGEDKAFEPNYVVGGLAKILPLEKGDVGMIEVYKTREDKTIDPLTERDFLIDSELVFHDDVTYSVLKDVIEMAKEGDEYPIEIVGSNYYDYGQNLFLDENLEPISFEVLPYDYDTYLMEYVGETSFEEVLGELIVVRNERTGLLGLFDKVGKEVVPFILADIGDAVDGVCVVRDVSNKAGLLTVATGAISWLDHNNQIEGAKDVIYVRHNVAAEGEPVEYNYKTYFNGKLMGDFDHMIEDDDLDPLSDLNLYKLVVNSETDLSSSVTFTLWEIK